jgi:hypothetical protein
VVHRQASSAATRFHSLWPSGVIPLHGRRHSMQSRVATKTLMKQCPVESTAGHCQEFYWSHARSAVRYLNERREESLFRQLVLLIVQRLCCDPDCTNRSRACRAIGKLLRNSALRRSLMLLLARCWAAHPSPMNSVARTQVYRAAASS